MSPPKSKIHFFGGTILLFLSMADRDFGLFRYGERAEYAFTGYGLKQLKESLLPQFGRGDWCGGFAGFLKACNLYLAQIFMKRLCLRVMAADIISSARCSSRTAEVHTPI